MSTVTTTHTPGPWSILPVHCWEFQIGAPGQGEYAGQKTALAVVRNWDCQPPGEQIYANACLIAAAPQLLAALADIVANIDQGGCPVAGSVMHERARAAIALAEGR